MPNAGPGFAPESLESVIASPAARDAISSRASLLDYSYKEFIKHILRIARSMASEKAEPSHNRSFLAGPLASLPWARAFAACRSRLRCPVLSFVNLGLWRLRLSKRLGHFTGSLLHYPRQWPPGRPVIPIPMTNGALASSNFTPADCG